MLADEAKSLLGFSPDCRPSSSQVKTAYRTKVWETHPDRFPAQEKSRAEYKFKMISEAYSCLRSGLTERKSRLILLTTLFFLDQAASGGGISMYRIYIDK
ncbi:unnamed protein product [Cuscuta europaea]|uniref:J domain-containing protein n=1 Tax=Cuscuta europaea TaxID=41803 RepID=A0A9P1E4Z4_CUSEU|nr:unnamed protein product [Cuscuta europaea]